MIVPQLPYMLFRDTEGVETGILFAMKSRIVFSRQSDEWSTPPDFFAKLHQIHHFTLDAAASFQNSKLTNYFGLDHVLADHRDALAVLNWAYFGKSIWCNPPYSLGAKFIAKAVEATTMGATVVMLLPARTDTKWYQTYVWDTVRECFRPGVHVNFVKGRLKFGGSKAGAPFPSIVVTFSPVQKGTHE